MSLRANIAAAVLIFFIGGAVSGQDGLALMKVEAGARPAGMGGAFVSIAADPNAGFYNPTGAAGADRFTASLGHNTYWENVRLETGYFACNLSDRSWLLGGIRYASVDNIESRLSPTSEPDALFSAYDVSLKAGLARQLADKLAVGFALGWFIEKIDVYRGSVFNLDLGALYRASSAVNVGASVTNLGSDLSLTISGQPDTDNIPIPTTYRAGASYRYRDCLGAADLVVVDEKTRLHLGAEGLLHEYVTIRAGYMFNYDSKSYTAGASFRRRDIEIDYAFVPYSNSLGTSHLFNLTFTL